MFVSVCVMAVYSGLCLFQYVLSAGKDSLVKLWELSTARCLIAYTGAGSTGQMEHRAPAAFNHTEDYGQHQINTSVT